VPAYTPEQCDELFTRFANACDLEGLVSLYEADAVLAQAEGPPARGAAAIRAALAELLASAPRLEMKVVRALRAGDDLAALTSDYSIEMTGPDAKRFSVAGRSAVVTRRQPDGSWRIAIDDPYAGS
jgi:uncharacterized protein (TIGR02246 family)